MSKELITEQDRTEFRREWGIKEDANSGEAPAWMNNTPMTADAFRAKSDKHDHIAKGLVSGEAKDAHLLAKHKS